MPVLLLLLAAGCHPAPPSLDADARGKVDLTSPDWVGTSGVEGGRFASSVAGVGDMNGDGYDELAVGSHRYTRTWRHEGAAYIYLGGPKGLEAAPILAVEGAAASAFMGGPARPAGDLDRDGYADAVFGAAGLDFSDSTLGAVHVWYGSAAGPSDPWSYAHPDDPDGFGWGAVGVGDVNGDGYDDVACSSAQDGNGTVYLFFGGAGRLGSTYDAVLEGTEDGSLFGFAMLGVGDVSGDGIDDFLVGAPGTDGVATNSGGVYLYLGDTSGSWSSYAWSIEGDTEEQRFGRTLATPGDVNGDGYGDLLISGGMDGNPGGAWLFAGNGAGWDSTAAWSGISDQDGSQYGESIAGIGDINLDGYFDIAVGAPNYLVTVGDEGALFIHYGGPSWPSTTPDHVFYGTDEGEILGKAVAGVGDVNGDGGWDFAFGAAGADETFSTEGRAEVYHGDVPAVDTGTTETGVIDTGPTDTGVIDTGPTETGVIDTGPTETGAPDSGDSGNTDSGPDLYDPEKSGFYQGGCGCSTPARPSGVALGFGVLVALLALRRRVVG